ncbi:MAG: PKD domain-containing protein [Flavobacteriales bacterium]|nr:PKD domain-containing protein [Flavobacteriales bacterium]
MKLFSMLRGSCSIPVGALALFFGSTSMDVQAVTIFTENIGTGTGTQSFAATTFQNSGTYTYSGTGDTRTSTPSSGYTGSSGGKNVFLTNSGGVTFQMTSIVTTGYTNLALSFGAYKSTVASDMTELVVEYSTDGTSWNTLTFPAQTTGTGTAIWRLVTITGGTIPAAANLRLRWTNSSLTPQFRIDDITLTGDLVSSDTNVFFDVASATVSEGVGTYNVTVNLTDPSGSQATGVDVVLVSGSGARINGFTSQTISFPTGTSTPINVTLTVTDDAECNGNEVLTFALQNLTGGSGTPTAGANRTLTVTDNEAVIGEVIARQAFDGLGSDTWPITLTPAGISTATGGTDTPASQRILSGTTSWQVSLTPQTLELGNVDVSGYSNTVVQLRVSGTSVNGTNGLDTPDEVRVYVALNGGTYPISADITVTGNSNARYGYGSTGVASTTAGTPATFGPAAGGNITNGYATINIAIPNGTNTIDLRVVSDNDNTNEVWNIDDIQVTGDRCNTTYYSRSTDVVGNPIWSQTPSGTAGPATFSRFTSMVVQSPDVVTIDADTRVNLCTVDVGGTLALAANQLTVSGTALAVNGTMSGATDSEVVLDNAAATTVTVASATTLFDLTVNTPLGTTVTGTLEFFGTLQLNTGNFDCTGNQVVLRSNATHTGRLGEITSATYTGNMKIERYIPAGYTRWRLFGSAIGGRTVANWQDDFITAGYPGSQFPNFDSPPGSNILWPSIRWYDETDPGPLQKNGLVGVSSSAQSLGQCQGFSVWCGDALGGTAAFIVDLGSGAPYIATTPITIPLTWTDTSTPLVDGWNLVSNPLPSAIRFDQISRGANVEDYVHIYNPATGNMGVYDISAHGAGPGTEGATNIIQSGQGFWMQTTGTPGTTTVSESAKINDNSGGLFGGSVQAVNPALRIQLTSGINSFSDEAMVVFHEGTPGFDAADAIKYVFAEDDAPQVATLVDGMPIAINGYGALDQAMSIPVSVNVAVSGTYTITVLQAGEIGLTCITLEDLATGIITPVVGSATYSFTIDAADDETVGRFILHATAPLPLNVMDPLCGTVADGMATVNVTGAPADVTWSDDNGVLLMQEGVSGETAITGLSSGTYYVRVGSTGVCGDLGTGFTINAPFELEAAGIVDNATCAASTDGSVDLLVMGGVGPFTYEWNDADNTTTVDLVAGAGSYMVTVTDAHGCNWTSDAFVIAESGPVAEFGSDNTTVLVNTQVQFSNTFVEGTSFWEFGDGAIADEQAPSYSWNTPGTYTVTLTIDDGTCIASVSHDITVEVSTSVASIAATSNRAWATPQGIVLEHVYPANEQVQLELLDATGRVFVQRRLSSSRTTIPADGLSTGIWFVRLTHGTDHAIMRVPLIR